MITGPSGSGKSTTLAAWIDKDASGQKSFCIISQRLIAKKDGAGRVAAFEIFTSTPHTRVLLERFDLSSEMLVQAMREGTSQGMQHFQDEIEKLVRSGMINRETALESAGDVYKDHEASTTR
ncbi:MAG: hypothetical protein ACRD4K_09220 [Candidatus Acidiferrales bacterium]